MYEFNILCQINCCFSFFSCFSLDMSTAMEILQNVVNNMVQEFLQPDVNNLTPKQD